MKTGIWFLMFCKRCCKKGGFLLVLLFLPVAAFFMRHLEKQGESLIKIAVCTENPANEGTLEAKLLQALAGETGSEMFRFYVCETKEELLEEVATRRAECGYLIPNDLEKKIHDKATRRCIEVWSAPSSVAHKLSAELFFAVLMEVYTPRLFEEYVAESELFDVLGEPGSTERAELALRAGEEYKIWSGNGSTFHVESEIWSGHLSEQEMGSFARPGVFPVRGLAAIFVFLAGTYSAAQSLEDEKKGLFLPLSDTDRLPCILAALAAPVVLSSLSGLSAIFGAGEAVNGVRELVCMGLYVLTVCLYAFVLRLCRSKAVICCLIPMLLLACLVFCPVFLDAGRYLPQAELAGRFLLPWYYLRCFF